MQCCHGSYLQLAKCAAVAAAVVEATSGTPGVVDQWCLDAPVAVCW
jgi:hypothetical protein